MNALRQIIPRVAAPARSFKTSAPRLGGHVFDGKPFDAVSIGLMTSAVVISGTGIICGAAYYQNSKQGFLGKK
eukprot:CAMPEP_0172581740 /NCGR_PEP_ID=MMETSP1068-20121228/1072_1 /TAXON_ID=35684 /ORGANISM="Pseudopedinella elastica, Strain CCMP716" /LENGTH=72 /DNA_ID=CAMNT_0013374841 /DNA_START=32 /DNA_END=250 /DNA_ORIENTATION=+